MHTDTHSSQMLATGPAISLITADCGLSQKEHRRESAVPRLGSLNAPPDQPVSLSTPQMLPNTGLQLQGADLHERLATEAGLANKPTGQYAPVPSAPCQLQALVVRPLGMTRLLAPTWLTLSPSAHPSAHECGRARADERGDTPAEQLCNWPHRRAATLIRAEVLVVEQPPKEGAPRDSPTHEDRPASLEDSTSDSSGDDREQNQRDPGIQRATLRSMDSGLRP